MSDKSTIDDKETIIRLLSQVIVNLKALGLPKHPFIINAPSEDGHSLYLCIWPIATDEYRTKVVRLPHYSLEGTLEKEKVA